MGLWTRTWHTNRDVLIERDGADIRHLCRHRYIDGQPILRDNEGQDLVSSTEAIEQAVCQMPLLLASELAVQTKEVGANKGFGTNRIHLTIEINSGIKPVALVRGKVSVEPTA
jgi:hypothetical protein